MPASDAIENWVSVARINNLADLGYFEDLLSRGGIAMRVHERDGLDASGSFYQTTFVVQVPEHEADRASTLMQDEIDRSPDDAVPSGTTFGIPDPGSPFWRPLAWVMLAGGIACWGSQFLGQNGQPRPDAGGRQTLSQALGEIRQRLQAPVGPGRMQVKLGRNPDTGRLFLAEDFDGDGRWDRYREFAGERVILEQLP